MHFVGFFIYIMLECKENSYTKPTANLALKFLFKYTLKRNVFFTCPSMEEVGQFASPGVAVKSQMRLYVPLSSSCWYAPNPNHCFKNLFGMEDLMAFI